MRLLVSGATRTVRELLACPAFKSRARRFLGHLAVPAARNKVQSYLATGLPIACDNGCFGRFDKPAFDRMVREYSGLADWIVMPDIVCSAGGTGLWWEMMGYHYYFDRDADGLDAWAVVAQNGSEHVDYEGLLGEAACLFIGGDDAYKESGEVRRLARLAKEMGKLLHMGRVNTLDRLRLAWDLGCDSIDGSGCSRWPDSQITTMLRWMGRLDGMPFG